MANQRMAGQALAGARERQPEMVDRRNASAPVARPAENAPPQASRGPAPVSAASRNVGDRPVERREAPPMASDRSREMPSSAAYGLARAAERREERPEMRSAGPGAPERRSDAPASYGRSAAAPANGVDRDRPAPVQGRERVEDRRGPVNRPAERPQERLERPGMSHLRGYVAQMRERRGSAAQQQPQNARSAANTRS